MDPDTWPIKAQVGADEESGTGALGVLPVLTKQEKEDHQYMITSNEYMQLEIRDATISPLIVRKPF